MARFHITVAMLGELEVFEIDTVDQWSPLPKLAFVAALSEQRPSPERTFELALTDDALAYAAGPTGAFANAYDILRDQGRIALANRFAAAWTQARQALAEG